MPAADICALCAHYSIDKAVPELAAIGMGRCMSQASKRCTSVHVGWDAAACDSFVLERSNLTARRQYVQVQRLNANGEQHR